MQPPTRNYHFINKAAIAVYILFLLGCAVYSFKRPAYNWDMLAYMALTIAVDDNNPQHLHTKVYSTIQEELSPAAYAQLADTTHPFRKQVTNNPETFYSQLPFYAVKPLYIGMVYVFYKSGASLIQATLLPTTIAYILIGLLMLYWLNKYVRLSIAILISCLAMISPPLLQAATLSTPDCLSAFLLFTAIFFLYYKKAIIPAFLFLCLSVFARIDNVIACFILLTFYYNHAKTENLLSLQRYAVLIAISAGCYFAVSFFAWRLGWNIFYVSNFYNQSATVFHSGNSLKDYIMERHSVIMVAMKFGHFFIYTLMAVALFINIKSPLRWQNLARSQQLVISIFAIIIIRLLFHAGMEDRFFLPYYLVFIVLLIQHISLHNNPLQDTAQSNLQ